MPRIVTSVTELVGRTPLLVLPVRSTRWQVLLKLEKFNATQSVKDRMALGIVEDAERDGRLKPGGTIVESSSGNTGTALAMIAAARGYRLIVVVDHHAAREKVRAMEAYGAEVMRVGRGKPPDRVATAERETTAARIAREQKALFVQQAHNPSNAAAYDCLASELCAVLPQLDVLLGAVGTGGSLCGTARILKRTFPRLRCVAVEPVGSVTFGRLPGPYYQSGAGTPAGVTVARNIDPRLIDEHDAVPDAVAFTVARFVARRLGLLVGGTGGSVIYEALAFTAERRDQGTLVAIVPDGGEKYLDTIFNDPWITKHKLYDALVEDRLLRWLVCPIRPRASLRPRMSAMLTSPAVTRAS